MAFVIIGTGLFLGGLGAFAVGRFGEKLQFTDLPSERSSHSQMIPKGGGLGILVAYCLYSAWFELSVLLWMPAVCLSLISLLGDRIEISAVFRLFVQLMAAGITSWSIVPSISERMGFQGAFVPVCLLLSTLYVVVTANTYNFMDGINGLAGMTSVIAFGLLAVLGWHRGETTMTVMLAAVMASASLGFIPWNFPRARVFMGDVGSILLGFVFALIVLSWSDSMADLLMFSAFIYPFYLDELLTQSVRLKQREHLMKAHRRHIYQILVNQMKMAHWQVTLLYTVFQIVAVSLVLVVRSGGWLAEALLLLVLLFFAWAGATWVRRYE